MLKEKQLRDYVNGYSFQNAMGLRGYEEINLFPLGCGEYNLNYSFVHPITGKRLVLRVSTASQMHLERQAEYEYFALKDLEPSGRTPRAVFCDDSKKQLPYGVTVMEWLPGAPLNYQRDMGTAAEILADIHSLKVPESTRIIRRKAPAQGIYDECLTMAQHYLEWDRADKRVCGLIDTLITETGGLPLKETSGAPVCIVNTELNSGNFLINSDGKSYLIDWEKPLLSEPAQDLAHFLVPTTTFWKTDTILTPEETATFADNYTAAVGDRMDTSTVRERLPLFFKVTCLRGITWCAMAMREYLEPGRALRNEITFKKIQAYLAPDFLSNILENYVRKDFLCGRA